MEKQRVIVINKRRLSMMEAYLFQRERKQRVVEERRFPADQGILIFKSELDYISRCILDRKNIETGGQLFGYWSEDGRPVVMYAIGPGPKANHQSTFFNQDVDYLVSIGRFLKENYGLKHIGEWHSHHQLGLARPSGHDVHTMVSTIREKGLGQFLLCIGNCNNRCSSLNGYVCSSTDCGKKEWDVIHSASPVRHEIDARLSGVLKHPVTKVAVHADESLNDKAVKPDYATGYWLNEPGAGVILNQIMDYLRRKHHGAEVKAQLNGIGEVQLEISKGAKTERILFAKGFPYESPLIRCYYSGQFVNESDPNAWQYFNGNITGSFIHFYENI
jgi:hypothetical protein